MDLQFIIACAVNLVLIGIAYGLIRGRLDACEKAERELREEVRLIRDRAHELSNRMNSFVLEIFRLRNGGAK